MKLRSMTGFGQASIENDKIHARVEVKSLNGKFLDLKCWMPKSFYNREIDLRNKLTPLLERGTITFSLNFQRLESNDDGSAVNINHALAKEYHDKLKELSQELNEPAEDLLKIVMKLPDIMVVAEDQSTEEEWNTILDLSVQACKKLNEYRIEEGRSILDHLRGSIDEIDQEFKEIISKQDERKKELEERIYSRVRENIEENLIDKSRFEQELIYYLEKYDIAEEIQRLTKHIEYFRECLVEVPSGKKLGFIAQELGREINTMGVKSNYFPMQRSIVNMKESLEKIKEQVLNVM